MMARKPGPVPRERLRQPALPFDPLPPSRPLSPSREHQCTRAVLKLRRLIEENPYAGGLAEYTIDRLLRRGEVA